MTLAPPAEQDVIIVGATGDLARRKLLPALYNLFAAGALPATCSIIGLARSQLSDDDFCALARAAVGAHSRTGLDPAVWDAFARYLTFLQATPEGLRDAAERCKHGNRTIYVATPPDAMLGVVGDLRAAGLTEGARIIVEKPFGSDLASARELNRALHAAFDEARIFRIDHYLGKETVQNILVFRFGNYVFERIWNRDAIQAIQITVAESLGIEGRGAFYDDVGALRDVVQNHLLQMLALLTMEPPSSFAAEAVRDERAKLLHAVRDLDPGEAVRGQYAAGSIDGAPVPSYRDEPGVDPISTTETFVALRLHIDNWRWAGVPVYLRTGKRLARTSTEVDISFHEAPIDYVANVEGPQRHSNHLTLHIQPREDIDFRFVTKVPGPEVIAKAVAMQFSYEDAFMVQPAEAYERLIHDAMNGDQTLFVREDALEEAWRIVQPVLETPPPLHPYNAGTPGPVVADDLISPDRWHLRV